MSPPDALKLTYSTSVQERYEITSTQMSDTSHRSWAMQPSRHSQNHDWLSWTGHQRGGRKSYNLAFFFSNLLGLAEKRRRITKSQS